MSENGATQSSVVYETPLSSDAVSGNGQVSGNNIPTSNYIQLKDRLTQVKQNELKIQNRVQMLQLEEKKILKKIDETKAKA